jgi:hypothetical protein
MKKAGQELRTRPETLQASRLFALINAIPASADWKDFSKDTLFEYAESAEGVRAGWDNGCRLAVGPAIENWGSEARDYVLTNGHPENSIGIFERFQEALDFRDFVRSVAEDNNRFWDQHSVKSGDLPKNRNFKFPSTVTALAIRLDTGTKQWSLVYGGLFKDLLDNVELDRIKCCAYSKCGKIFWAGRVDKPCCSDACWNPFKQKRHREKKAKERTHA